MMRSLSGTILCAALAVTPALAEPAGCRAVPAFEAQDGAVVRPVRSLADALVFQGGLRVNTDGASNSYHPFGKSKGALNSICNAVGVTPAAGPYAGQFVTAISPKTLSGPARCKIISDAVNASRDAGWRILPEARIKWFAIPTRPTADNYGPCIQTSGPHAGFFVSTTALSSGATDNVCSVDHWIDSNAIPYITLPVKNAGFASAGAGLGDLALVHRKVGGEDRFVVAVVADRGNSRELGEGSVALHRALGNASASAGLDDGVTTFLFAKRAAAKPITAETLQRARDELLAALGGAPAALQCAGRD